MRKYLLPYLMFYMAARRGASAVEYSILAGGIALAVFIFLVAVGADFSDMMDILSGEMESAVDEVDLE